MGYRLGIVECKDGIYAVRFIVRRDGINAVRFLSEHEKDDLLFLALSEISVAKKLGLSAALTEFHGFYPKDIKKIIAEWHETWSYSSDFYHFEHFDFIHKVLYAKYPHQHPKNPRGYIRDRLEYMAGKCTIDPELLITASECRSFLFSYDDFIQGLRANQALFDYQKSMYGQKIKELEDAYAKQVQTLYNLAAAQGVVLEMLGEVVALPDGTSVEFKYDGDGKIVHNA